MAANTICSECDADLFRHEVYICHATCCGDVPDNAYCPRCWQEHRAQFFLDSQGFEDGSLGVHHARVRALMAQYREF